MTLNIFLALILLFTVITLIIIRPKGLNVAWPAGIGALIALLSGLIPLSILTIIFDNTWNACITLISLFILCDTLDSNKFFDWAAYKIALKANGSGRKLYIYILILTSFVTALLANDGVILILTPIIATILNTIYPGKLRIHLPFIFAVGFFADSMSIALLPGNLTNLIIADANHLTFSSFLLYMIIPTITAFIAGVLCFGLRFRKELNTHYTPLVHIDPQTIIRDRFTFNTGWIALTAMVIGYIIGGQFHLPVAVIIFPVAIAMLVIIHVRKLNSAKRIIIHAPWSILIFAIGMFIVITSAFNAGALNIITEPLKSLTSSQQPSDIFFSGIIYSLLSAVFNNLPASLIGVLSMKGVEHISNFAIYTIIAAVNIGPKLTPFGSLSTLIWLGILKRHNINISWWLYIKENWWVTVIVFIAAFGGLLISRIIFGN